MYYQKRFLFCFDKTRGIIIQKSKNARNSHKSLKMPILIRKFCCFIVGVILDFAGFVSLCKMFAEFVRFCKVLQSEVFQNKVLQKYKKTI